MIRFKPFLENIIRVNFGSAKGLKRAEVSRIEAEIKAFEKDLKRINKNNISDFKERLYSILKMSENLTDFLKAVNKKSKVKINVKYGIDISDELKEHGDLLKTLSKLTDKLDKLVDQFKRIVEKL